MLTFSERPNQSGGKLSPLVHMSSPSEHVRSTIVRSDLPIIFPCRLVSDFGLYQEEAYDLLMRLDEFRAVAIEDLLSKAKSGGKRAEEIDGIPTLGREFHHLALAFIRRNRQIVDEPLDEYQELVDAIQSVFPTYEVGVPLSAQPGSDKLRGTIRSALELLVDLDLLGADFLTHTRLSHFSALTVVRRVLDLPPGQDGRSTNLRRLLSGPAGFVGATILKRYASDGEASAAREAEFTWRAAFGVGGHSGWTTSDQKELEFSASEACQLLSRASDLLDKPNVSKMRARREGAPVHGDGYRLSRCVISLTPSQFAASSFDRPLPHVDIGYPRRRGGRRADLRFEQVAESPLWPTLRSLGLARLLVDDELLLDLFEGLRAPELRWLDLSGNPGLTERTVEAIACAVDEGRLPKLAWVGLLGTACDASPYIDGGYWRISAPARRLAGRFGYQDWMMLGSRKPEREARERLSGENAQVPPNRFSLR